MYYYQRDTCAEFLATKLAPRHLRCKINCFLESWKTTLAPTTHFAGGFAGVISWSLCIPANVLKSRLQTAPAGKYPNGMRSVVTEILQHEGPKGFFRGFVPIMLRAFPTNDACFLGMEIPKFPDGMKTSSGNWD